MQLPPPRQTKQGFTSLGRFSCGRAFWWGAWSSRRASAFTASKMSCSSSSRAGALLRQSGRTISAGICATGITPHTDEIRELLSSREDEKPTEGVSPSSGACESGGRAYLMAPIPILHILLLPHFRCPVSSLG